MTKFTNTGAGMRGIVMKDGTTEWADPGVTLDLKDADVRDGGIHADFDKGEAAAKRAAEAAAAAEPEQPAT